MDFASYIILFLVIFFMFSICSYCCRSTEQGAIYSTPVVVTSATHTTAGGYPVIIEQTGVYQAPYPLQSTPYPQNYGMGMPQPMVMHPPNGMPQPIGIDQPMGMPHQMNMSNPMVMPQPMGMSSSGYQPPYPPNPVEVAAGTTNPPSYDQVISSQHTYSKQSPYNPNYTGH